MIIKHREFPNHKKYTMELAGRPLTLEVGKLAELAGLVVGNLSDMHDNRIPFGKTAGEIVWEHVAEYGYPVCFGFPAGHADPADNRALVFGRSSVLSVGEDGVELKTV